MDITDISLLGGLGQDGLPLKEAEAEVTYCLLCGAESKGDVLCEGCYKVGCIGCVKNVEINFLEKEYNLCLSCLEHKKKVLEIKQTKEQISARHIQDEIGTDIDQINKAILESLYCGDR